VIAPSGDRGDRLLDLVAPLIALRRAQQGGEEVKVHRVDFDSFRSQADAVRRKKNVFQGGTELRGEVPGPGRLGPQESPPRGRPAAVHRRPPPDGARLGGGSARLHGPRGPRLDRLLQGARSGPDEQVGAVHGHPAVRAEARPDGHLPARAHAVLRASQRRADGALRRRGGGEAPGDATRGRSGAAGAPVDAPAGPVGLHPAGGSGLSPPPGAAGATSARERVRARAAGVRPARGGRLPRRRAPRRCRWTSRISRRRSGTCSAAS